MSDHESPCASHIEFSKAVWRVIGILILVGGGAMTYNINRSAHAERMAEEALASTRDNDVLRNDVKYMGEAIAKIETALTGMSRIEISLASVAGDIKAMNTRMDSYDWALSNKQD